MKRKVTFAVLILVFNLGVSQELEKGDYQAVKTFIDCIKGNDLAKLKTLVAYPLKREYPLSDIDDEIEFETRFNEIFDGRLKTMIASSNINTDWSATGWRGIMLNNGDVWLGHDGKLIAVNYQSDFERDRRIEFIEKDKNSIHKSLENFEEPVVVIETKTSRIRIDKLDNGKYRYASCPLNSDMSEKPDLMINNGIWIPEGSGGNHRYEFINGSRRYECQISILSTEDTPSAELEVYENDRKIVSEPGQLIRNKSV